MYGVRFMNDGQIVDLKIFEALLAAQELFQQRWTQAYDGYFDSIAIYYVPDAKNARDADSAIRNVEKERIKLVEFQESQDIVIAKLAKKIRVNL